MQSNPVNYRTKILVFDTETTGLIPKPGDETGTNPYIIQLAFVLYDLKEQKVLRTYNRYVKIAPEIIITEKITQLTGITREICDGGDEIIDVLTAFYHALQEADILVAHNLEFDMKIVSYDTFRNFKPLAERIDGLQEFLHHYCAMQKKMLYCTMRETRLFCNIRKLSLANKPYIKYPTLAELYEKLYGQPPAVKLHDALQDVLVCLCSYLKYKHGYEMVL